jgi:pyruvate/2-oxoglutarate dehydrogenase complex dihydrolipoamide dehydrogenase (E3) component
MSNEKFDVVIIGGGNAGIGVTGPARRAGLSVAMIEARDLGGTCPNRGCTPKKVLVAAGQALHDINLATQHRIDVGKAKLGWAALIAREKQMIENIPENLARAMARRNVEEIKGHGTFAGPDSVRVGGRTLHAGHIVVAAGSKPRRLPIPGAEHMVTSDDMLSESRRPESVVFIGGGVISLEFGHVYARAGSSVTILEALPQLLPAMDTDAVAALQAESERIGLQIRTGVKIERTRPPADGSASSLLTRISKRPSKLTGWSMAPVALPMSMRSVSPRAKLITTMAASPSTGICAQPPIRASIYAAMPFRRRPNSRPSRPTKAISSVAISSMGRSTVPTMPASQLRSIRFPLRPLQV